MAIEVQTSNQKIANVLHIAAQMRHYDHWNEVFLNCVKESPMTYEAFAQAVQLGDASWDAFIKALEHSQMTKADFDRYLPEFIKFMALYSEFSDIGMLSDSVDAIWHGFQLVSARYRAFCLEFLGRPVDHFPCSLYPLYGVEAPGLAPPPGVQASTPPLASCVGKCVPSTCKDEGGGCKPEDVMERDTNPETVKERIVEATRAFIDSYTLVFGQKPDQAIWNQIPDRLL